MHPSGTRRSPDAALRLSVDEVLGLREGRGAAQVRIRTHGALCSTVVDRAWIKDNHSTSISSLLYFWLDKKDNMKESMAFGGACV
jgi:hypothetical protein